MGSEMCIRDRCTDPLFRLNARRWALGEGDLEGLVCVREPNLRLLRLDYDVAAFRIAKAVADFPSALKLRPSAIVIFGRSNVARREPLFIDESTARILDLSDGTRTAAEIITQLEHEQAGAKGNELEWIEYLFVEGLIGLRQKNPTYVSANAKSEQICEQYG